MTLKESQLIMNIRKFVVLITIPLWYIIISGCEHHCCPPIEVKYFERTLEIRQPLTTMGDGDAYLNSHITLENLNGRNDIHNIVAKWTRFSDPVNYRTYLKLDCSQIQEYEEIVSATLYLHTKPTGSDNKVPDIVNENSEPNYVQICLAKEACDLDTLSWVRQPKFSTLPTESIIFTIPPDFPSVVELDVTPLLKNIAGRDKKYENNGFIFRMLNEEYITSYQSFVFYSINSGINREPYMKVRLKLPF